MSDDTPQVVRANLALLVSRAISLPSTFSPDSARRLRDTGEAATEAWKPAITALADEWARAIENGEEIALAYARLFLGPFEILAPPYASFYLDPEQRLMGDVSRVVADAYAKAGLVPGSGPREMPDHVALEWELIYFLTYQYLVLGDATWLRTRDDFVRTHLDLWLPRLCERICSASAHPFYDRWAELVLRVLPGFPCSA